jgi:hypothetical protein
MIYLHIRSEVVLSSTPELLPLDCNFDRIPGTTKLYIFELLTTLLIARFCSRLNTTNSINMWSPTGLSKSTKNEVRLRGPATCKSQFSVRIDSVCIEKGKYDTSEKSEPNDGGYNDLPCEHCLLFS